MLDTCRTCPLYSSGMPQYVPPTIPLMSLYNLHKILIIGEAPGEQEVIQKRGFVGDSGSEQDMYLKRAKVPKNACVITNLVRCRPPDNRDPKNSEVACCEQHLEELLNKYKPRIIVAVGRYAARWFLPKVNMEAHHGIPFEGSYGCIIIPVYHPSYGLHETARMTMIAEDYQMIRKVLDAKKRPRSFWEPKCGGEGDSSPISGTEIYEEITSVAKFWASVSMSTSLSVDTESIVVGSEPDPEKDKLWCITYSNSNDKGYMIREPYLWQEFGFCVNKPHRTVIFHNAPYDMRVLAKVGIHPCNVEDTMQMAYLLQDVPLGLKPLAFRLCNIVMKSFKEVVGKHGTKKALDYLIKASTHDWPIPEVEIKVEKGQLKFKQPQGYNQILQRALNDYAKDPELDLRTRWLGRKDRVVVEDVLGPMPQPGFDDIPIEEALEYACKDAIATWRIFPILQDRIKAAGLEGVYKRDIGIIPLVMQMMQHGMLIKPQYFRDLSKYFTAKMDICQRAASRLYQISTGKKEIINPNSPPQVAEALYQMGIYKKKGLSTAKEYMDKYKSNPKYRPMITAISEYRELKKLRGTYSDTLPTQVGSDGRLHTKISMIRTVTGRLASSNPNLMNQPTSSEIGRRIRAGFIPKPGWVYASLDYSQIEMRLMAHMAQDELMCSMFKSGADIHSETASRMFRIPIDQVDKEKHRYPAKRVSFGIIYRISEVGLYKQMLMEGLNYTENECRDMITSWFNVYKGIRRYVSEVEAEARRTGLVRDMFGRYRLIPEVHSSLGRIRSAGLRQACNAPIQGGAQGIIKEAMVKLKPLLEVYEDVCHIVLQIHDDLLFEIREDKIEEVVPQIQRVMERAVKLSIPTPVDPKVGYNWRDMVGFKEFLINNKENKDNGNTSR